MDINEGSYTAASGQDLMAADTIYQALYVQSRGAMRVSWSPAYAPGRPCGCRIHGRNAKLGV
ncbi:MAG: hypothetical protein ACKVWR_01855 [Acidimicrobiales bacterium]